MIDKRTPAQLEKFDTSYISSVLNPPGVEMGPAQAAVVQSEGYKAYAKTFDAHGNAKETGEGFALTGETDPNGLHLNTPGAKADAGKNRPALVLGGFARALWEVSKVGTGGAIKYTDNGWMEVPNGISRYDDADMRHWLKEKMGEKYDSDTELLHAAHKAWNALARLDLLLREREKSNG